MRKILVATLVAAPLLGFAAYAFAANGAVSGEGSVDVLSATVSPAPSIAGKVGTHKRLSIKGIAIDDEDALETGHEAENDD
jgi:hypothetical protein